MSASPVAAAVAPPPEEARVAPNPAALSFLASPKRMLVDGRFVAALSGETLEVENPATGEVMTTIPAAGEADVDAAVAAARRTFDAGVWRSRAPADRARCLWRLADLLEANLDELAYLEVLDNGMPISRAPWAMSRGFQALRYYAGMAMRVEGKTVEISAGGGEYHAYTVKEPVGVAALITPWNGPLSMVCNKIAPALAAGCSVVVKPAEQTSLTALRLATLVAEAGIPDGVVNILTGVGGVAGAALARHPDVDKISFTGSTAVGKRLVQDAAGNLKRLSLELGGKSPVFVFDDADFDIAIPGAAAAIFNNSGQICFAGSRLYVQRRSFDRVVAGIAAIAGRMRLGDGLDRTTELGPLVSARQQQTVLDFIRSGIEGGAELAAGGGKEGERGYFVRPTVFANPDPGLRMVKDEIFGPVLAVMPFDGLEDVDRLANATNYGLGAGVFTTSVSTAHKVAKIIRSGHVWINCYGVTDKAMPFGGYKESGWGREGGQDGIEAFLEHKAVYARL